MDLKGLNLSWYVQDQKPIGQVCGGSSFYHKTPQFYSKPTKT
jgi:hypothetical protein